jgi:hypothetical protein
MTEQAGAESLRTYEEINAKIKRGDAVVVTADEFISFLSNIPRQVAFTDSILTPRLITANSKRCLATISGSSTFGVQG